MRRIRVALLGVMCAGWMGRVSGMSKLTPTLFLNLNYRYRAPLKIERGQFATVRKGAGPDGVVPQGPTSLTGGKKQSFRNADPADGSR